MDTTEQHLDLILNGSLLQPVTLKTILGIYVDHCLHWNEHISGVCRTVSHNIAQLRRSKKYLPLEARVQFYNPN